MSPESTDELQASLDVLRKSTEAMLDANAALASSVTKLKREPTAATLKLKLAKIIREQRLTRHGLAPKQGPSRAPKTPSRLYKLVSFVRRQRTRQFLGKRRQAIFARRAP